jgi:hypothetical protein
MKYPFAALAVLLPSVALAQLSPGGGGKPPCFDQFMPLRADAEKKAAAIKAASERKSQPEMCAALKTFEAAEAKVVKFVTDNNVFCGIPDQAVTQMKSNHAKTTKLRVQVCNAGAAAAPRPPSLSDALGTTALPDASSPSSKPRGTFDTLTGNPLAR